jgi:hypothetical protein
MHPDFHRDRRPIVLRGAYGTGAAHCVSGELLASSLSGVQHWLHCLPSQCQSSGQILPEAMKCDNRKRFLFASESIGNRRVFFTRGFKSRFSFCGQDGASECLRSICYVCSYVYPKIRIRGHFFQNVPNCYTRTFLIL